MPSFYWLYLISNFQINNSNHQSNHPNKTQRAQSVSAVKRSTLGHSHPARPSGTELSLFKGATHGENTDVYEARNVRTHVVREALKSIFRSTLGQVGVSIAHFLLKCVHIGQGARGNVSSALAILPAEHAIANGAIQGVSCVNQIGSKYFITKKKNCTFKPYPRSTKQPTARGTAF